MEGVPLVKENGKDDAEHVEPFPVEQQVIFYSSRIPTPRVQDISAIDVLLPVSIETFNAYVYICSMDYRIEFMNAKLMERTGYDATGEFCYKALHNRSSKCPWCPNDRVFRGESVQWEVQSPRDNRWYHVINIPVKGTDGRIAKQGIIQDITEQKRAEVVLREECTYRDAVIQKAAEGICVCHETPGRPFLRFTVWNGRMTGITGYTMEEINRRGWFQSVFPDRRRRAMAVRRMRGMEKDLVAEEWQITCAGGEEKTVRVSASILRTADGLDHVLGMFEDITDRKKTEQRISKYHCQLEKMIEERTMELRKANDLLVLETTERQRMHEAMEKAYRQLQDIIDFLPDATFVIDKDKKVIAWNRAIEKMIGVRKEDIIGRGDYAYAVPFYGERRPIIIDFILSEDNEFKKQYDFLDEKERTVCGGVWVPMAYQGRGAYLWGIASPLFDQNGNMIGAIESIRDITENKRAERALQESEEKLRFLSSRLLAVQEEERRRISRELHDSIGQCLAAVKFCVEGVLQTADFAGYESTVKTLKSLVPMIQDSIEEARRIYMGLRPSMLDDLGIIATIAWLCRDFRKTYAHICLEDHVGAEDHEIPERLRIVIFRIIQEALNNVVKYSNANLVSLSLERTGEALVLEIVDNGVGFDLEKALKKRTHERGLGLTGMRERAELSGGSFSITSDIGVGTAIRAVWPLFWRIEL